MEWDLKYCNMNGTHNHLIHKGTLSHLANNPNLVGSAKSLKKVKKTF